MPRDSAATGAQASDGRWRLGHRPGLDGLRGFAILLVMADHAGIAIASGAGDQGVTVFFVLSGFLITTLLLEERARYGRVSLRRFYWRRALRLLPALGALLLVVGVVMGVSGRADEIAGDVLPVLLYFMNWTIVAGNNPGIVGHTWSLSVEEQFYFVWPLVLLGMMAIGRGRLAWVSGLLLGAVVVSIALRVLLWASPGGYYRTFVGTDTRMDALAIGCLVAVAFSRRPIAVPGSVMAALAATIPIILWITNQRSMAAIGFAVTAFAAAGIVAGAASGRGERILGWRPLAYVGLISYGLYLWHRPLMRIFTDSGLGGVPWAVALMFAISLGLAFLSRRFIEDPFLALKDRYFTSRAIRERAADGPRRECEDRTVAAEVSQ
jgi:peptidoglycan/LPS O-acetylase OafA/YrhL